MNIQIYADKVDIESEPTALNVYLQGVDVSQIISELNAEEVLEALDFTAIADYYIEALKD